MADQPQGQAQPLGQHHFLLRRLHSLSGIVPIGVFLIVHLVTNSSVAWGGFALRGEAESDLGVLANGAKYFQEEVHWINTSVPHLLLIEITLWVSIAFHSILGFYYAFTGKRNTGRYPYQDNWRYTLQRWSGYVGILFIFYHVATLRWGWDFLIPGSAQWSHHFSASTLAAALRGSEIGWTPMGFAVAFLYFAGITLLVFHFANGLWTAAITWGLTISEGAQRRWGYACAVVGVGLMAAAWSSLGGFLALDHERAELAEMRLLLNNPEAKEAAIKKVGEQKWLALLEKHELTDEPAEAGESAAMAEPISVPQESGE